MMMTALLLFDRSFDCCFFVVCVCVCCVLYIFMFIVCFVYVYYVYCACVNNLFSLYLYLLSFYISHIIYGLRLRLIISHIGLYS
jgi:hypothetical protein